VRNRPWVNLTAQWSESCFRAGVRVIGPDADRACFVRLSFVDGMTLADTVDNGTVLFETDQSAAFPAEVQLIDGSGDVLVFYPEFFDFG